MELEASLNLKALCNFDTDFFGYIHKQIQIIVVRKPRWLIYISKFRKTIQDSKLKNQ